MARSPLCGLWQDARAEARFAYRLNWVFQVHDGTGDRLFPAVHRRLLCTAPLYDGGLTMGAVNGEAALGDAFWHRSHRGLATSPLSQTVAEMGQYRLA